MELAKKIVEEATSKAYEIVKQAKEEKANALKEEEQRLKQENKSEMEKFRKLIEERKREEQASMKLEYKRAIDRAYEEKFKEILSLLVEDFKRYKKTKNYSSFLNNLLEKAKKELSSKETDLVIHVAKGDKKHLKTKASVKEDLDDIGGIIVETKDGKVRVNFSFSSILEMKIDSLRQKAIKEISSSKKKGRKR